MKTFIEILEAVVYLRYSTDHQDESSLAYQLAQVQEYARKNNIVIKKVYQDEALTGTNTDRPGYQQMMHDAKSKKFNAIIIYDITRGSRDVSDWFAFRKTMEILGIKVLSINDNLGDLLNPSDFLQELITVGIGQHHVLTTRQKSMDSIALKAKEGLFLGGIAPLGYDICNGKYIINPQEAKYVKLIFSMYADGKSYSEILFSIKDARGKKGQPLGKNSLHSILRNERYIGVYTWNKRKVKIMGKWAGGKANEKVVRIEDFIPAIIDMNTWERVQKRMNNNKRNATNKAKREYLLSGLIECEACGNTYVGHTSTNKKGYSTRYYICGNKYRTHTCHNNNINADKLEELIIEHLKNFLLQGDFNELAEEICAHVNNATIDLTTEKKELREIEEKIKNGTAAILKGMDYPELREEIDELRRRKSQLEDIIYQGSKAKHLLDKNAVIELLKESTELLNVDPKVAIKRCITKIYANTDKSITVNMGVHLNGCGGRI